MRVLISGAGGQLGLDVVAACVAAGDDVHAFDSAGLDIGSRSDVHGAITMLRPDAVINCAAWTAVDACEADPDRALAVTGTGGGGKPPGGGGGARGPPTAPEHTSCR